MDYKRIYVDFINSRRGRSFAAGEYSERHHILPRSMGGSDASENLIDLSPEDHYFAHLLLAKAHGGKMINALWRMLQRSEKNWGRKECARRSYGTAQRIVARYLATKWTAEGNPLFNPTPFRWWNYRSGEERVATIYEMHARYGAGRPSWTQVATGDRPSIKGWMLENRRETHKRSEKGQAFRFVNRDGRSFQGTQGDFAKAFGLNLASCSRIVRRASVTECGWRLEGVADRRANGPKDGSRGPAVGRGRVYKLRHRDGREFCGTAEDFRIAECKPEGFQMAVRLSGLRRGAAPSLYGWRLVSYREPRAT